MSYPKTESKVDFQKIEQIVLKNWENNDIFKQIKNNNKNGERFLFFDGPVTPSSIPHTGHLGVSSVKDMVCRYNYMKGKNVVHKLGWDVHGLPTEIMVEKLTNKQTKDLVKEFGISKFCEMCKTGVMRYVEEWAVYLQRIGRLVEIGEGDVVYNTMYKNYMESVIWGIKTLYEKGLVYKDFKVNPYDWALGTVISNSEASSEYKDICDDAVTVAFELNKKNKILVWTTTPWTLPANEALAVNKNIEYLFLEDENEVNYIISESCVKKYKDILKNLKQVKKCKGSELVGLTYKPLFDYYNDEKLYKIISADYVSNDSGTGIVHLAPAFGEDDYIALKQIDSDFPIIVNVDEDGNFTEEVKNWAGLNIFEATPKIIEFLKNAGVLIKKESYKHSYPFSPRSKKKLIYRATEAWYIDVPKILNNLLQQNKKVEWKSAGNRFLNWIENARPWGISRNRFWGVPLPIWKNNKGQYKVFGSVQELEEFFDVKINDLHRSTLDNLKKDDWVREPYVLDAWFESGSMPYAYMHYPFENKEIVENANYISDYIVEGQDQTRGWFYTLMVLSTALFNRPAFKVVSANGHVVDEHKKKLSKSLQNYTDPFGLFNKYGADSIRLYILGSNFLKAEPLSIDKEGLVFKEYIKNILTPLWNAYHFFTLYANASNLEVTDVPNCQNILDKYIVNELRLLSKKYIEFMDQYKTDFVIKDFIKFLDILNNWYIRRSRERFWTEEREAFNTLYYVLKQFCQMLAPFAPFITDYIYNNLYKQSVHLEHFKFNNNDIDLNLISKMRNVQDIVSSGKQLREKYKISNRQPLNAMTIVGTNVSDYENILKDELNVKNIIFANNINEYAKESIYLVTPKLGAKLGSGLKIVTKNIENNNFVIKDGRLYTGDFILEKYEFEKRLLIKDGITGIALSDNTAVIIIDTVLTDDLINEWLANEIRRFIQETRKNIGLDISDRINLTFEGDSCLIKAIHLFENRIKNDALIINMKEGKGKYDTLIDKYKFSIDIEKC